MEQSTPRTMAAMPWLLLLCLAAGGALRASAQPDSRGFISLDCGLPAGTSYVGSATNITVVSDAGFIDAGTARNISVEYITPTLARSRYVVRSFLDGARNCYTLTSLEPGLKYLVRAMFMYGNYDGLRSPPVFDLHIGANRWTTVNVTAPDTSVITEVIAVVPESFVQVCLVNTGGGTPFISQLDLRPLKVALYPQATAAQSLVLQDRLNFGPVDPLFYVRYPDDPHDRVWFSWVDTADWSSLSSTMRVENLDGDVFEAPTKVMQTAITPRNASQNIKFSWAPEQPDDKSLGYIGILHFSELQLLPGNVTRQFYVNLNDKLWFPQAYTPGYRYADAVYSSNPAWAGRYDISINATANSTLPPLLNAMEVFAVISTATVGTDSQDASAMMEIKKKYQVHKNWMGDPCVPKTMAWEGLTCSYAVSSPPRITSVNMSLSGLNGDISDSFANLKALQYLDLSSNNLTGSVPDSLSLLPSLTFLDLSGNKLNGTIPSGLLKRIQDGSLNLRYENNPNLCSNGNSCDTTKRKNNLAMYIAVPLVIVVVIVLVALLLFCLLRKRQPGSVNKQQNEVASNAPTNEGSADSSLLRLDNRRFTYKELESITNNFQRVLGRGGFGHVYHGILENGTQVAVKLRSHSSNQGVKEFLAEAKVLTQIHHKNLVSMIGYCKDGEYMAIVYDYMPEGTLQEHIAGNDRNKGCLPWRQRLRIALEAAQGLEYLHKGCNPPLIHRDVKTTNILLNAKLEAKVADFGLSKAFNYDNNNQELTNTLIGTPGYLDPVYQATMQPSTKSDVYSFGVVLLELVTGKPAILRDPEPISVIQWARQRLARGNIEGVVDVRMRGIYDVNGVWKTAEVAFKCTGQVPVQRPTMTDVVAQLQECLELEEGNVANNIFHAGNNNDDPNFGYNAYATDESTDMSMSSTIEMEHNFRRVPTMATGPDAR